MSDQDDPADYDICDEHETVFPRHGKCPCCDTVEGIEELNKTIERLVNRIIRLQARINAHTHKGIGRISQKG